MALEIPTKDEAYLLSPIVKVPSGKKLQEGDDNFQIRVHDMRNKRFPVSHLKGQIASRMYWLFREYADGKYADEDFNCFNAVRYITGVQDSVTEWHGDMKKFGKEDSPYDIIKYSRIQFPFISQFYGDYKTKENVWNEKYIVHAGLVIGKDESKIPIVCDKPGFAPLRITQFEEAWKPFHKKYNPDRIFRAVRCLGLDEYPELKRRAT